MTPPLGAKLQGYYTSSGTSPIRKDKAFFITLTRGLRSPRPF